MLSSRTAISHKYRSLPTAVALLMALFLPVSSAQAEEEWELQKDDEGIQLYTRKVASSPFLEVKVTTRISSPMEKLTEVFGDGSGCAPWRNNCKSSKVLRQESEAERFIYMILDLPWPISDRDLVVRSLTITDLESQSTTVDASSVEGEYPEQDYVRAISRAQYQMHLVEPGEIDLTYTVHVDLGGDISPGLVNSQLASTTFKEIEQLVKMAEG
ncbi:MAG: hypothetical protein ACI9NT_000792 [Bacteroidia bacterium]|jgi:hypothetical protein